SVDAHLAGPAEARCVKHGSASGNEDLILKSASDNMRVRADEAVVSNAQRMARGTSENGVLHDDALPADTYSSPLGDHLRSEHDATAQADRDVATDHSIRSDPGGGVYSWCGAIVFDKHLTPPRFVHLAGNGNYCSLWEHKWLRYATVYLRAFRTGREHRSVVHPIPL